MTKPATGTIARQEAKPPASFLTSLNSCYLQLISKGSKGPCRPLGTPIAPPEAAREKKPRKFIAILQFGLNILQFPEDFFVFWAVLDIDNITDSFIMESVVEKICLMRCKGVSAEE
jgi:hypothetical protein